MDTARLRSLVAQHAETARLMGVDAVPAYRSAGAVDAKHGGTPAGLLTDRVAEPKPVRVNATAFAETPAEDPSSLSAPDARTIMPQRPAPRDRAETQRRLDDLKARYEREAPHQHFVTAHTKIVFGEGDPCARLMFVGEAPGEEEDRLGRPFVGRSGQLLDKMIAAMGLKREDVYIANVLKTRPPNNATPTHEEARLCAPYLFEQIRIVAPEAIVTLGLPATRLLLDTQDAMGKLRARWQTFVDPAGRAVPVMPTYHPAYLLRNYTPAERAKVWSDLQQVMQRLGLGGEGGKASG